MPNRKQIIAITVLGIAALMLGCKPKPNPVKPNPNPVKPRTISRKDIVGTYERKSGAITGKWVFLDNGTSEQYANGKKRDEDFKWSIVDNQIHIVRNNNVVAVYRLNPDNSITYIANIIGGKRTDYAKEQQQKNAFWFLEKKTEKFPDKEPETLAKYIVYYPSLTVNRSP